MKSGSVSFRSCWFVVSIAAVAGVSPGAFGCSLDGKEGFLPKNNLKIPAGRQRLNARGVPLDGGISEAEFNGVITAVEKIYAPIARKKGGNLVFRRLWTNPDVNAEAEREDGNWNVNMFGGMARHKETTIDGFLLVVCHEVGHQLGGAPKYDRGRGSLGWASNEGQADYFATLKCARRVLEKEPNLRAIREEKAPEAVRAACRASFRDANAEAICVRTHLAGLSLGRVLAAINRVSPPKLGTTDPHRVDRTEDGHPAPQCRVDTYAAGAVCPKDFRDDVSETDPTAAACSEEKGDRIGVRPRCWYAPGDDNRGTRVDPRRVFAGRAR